MADKFVDEFGLGGALPPAPKKKKQEKLKPRGFPDNKLHAEADISKSDNMEKFACEVLIDVMADDEEKARRFVTHFFGKHYKDKKNARIVRVEIKSAHKTFL